jgi:hypothetical protein
MTQIKFICGINSGRGFVQDGNIMTSGTCPMMARMTGHKDGTAELTIAHETFT